MWRRSELRRRNGGARTARRLDARARHLALPEVPPRGRDGPGCDWNERRGQGAAPESAHGVRAAARSRCLGSADREPSALSVEGRPTGPRGTSGAGRAAVLRPATKASQAHVVEALRRLPAARPEPEGHSRSLRPSRAALALGILGLTLVTLAWPQGPAATGAGRPAAPEPSTRITGSPGPKSLQRRPRFRFDSPSGSVHFQCTLGRGGWRPCSSPHRTRRLARGWHTFRVRALTSGGVADSTPAERRFRVLRRRVTFGHSVRGTELDAVRLGDPNAARKALVVGSIHGNEPEGQEIVHVLKHRYRHLRGVELWVVKSVNPDGVAGRHPPERSGRRPEPQLLLQVAWGSVPVERRLPGPAPVLGAGEPRGEAPGEASPATGDHLVPPALGPGSAAVPWPRPRAEALRAHRPLPDQALPRTAAAGHRVELAEPPSPRHRVRGRAAGRRAAGLARRAATLARRRRWRRAGPEPGARLPAGRWRTAPARARLRRPPIDRDPIPYGHQRKHQMAAYSKRHYGKRRWRLLHPRVIVLHFTAGPTYRSAWETFASDAPNMGELPGVCSHFVVAKNGRIHRLVRPGDPLPAHDRAEPPRDRGRDGAGEPGEARIGPTARSFTATARSTPLCTWSAGSSSASGSG